MPMVDFTCINGQSIKQCNCGSSYTHTHLDHWDDTAIKSIPKSLPIFVQNTADKELIISQGFNDVRIILKVLSLMVSH